MEFLTLNLKLGKVRKAIHNGREYFVAPVTTIVPGVLNGSQGALFYPPNEIADSVRRWNGIHVTVYHPMTANGDHVSASHPGILEKQGVGRLRQTRYLGKLLHELWVDVERSKRVDKRVYNAMEKGEPMEVSTGLYTDNEPAPNGANFRGKGYEYIARNYRPDHLAILPDQIGACSLSDGCGVLVNKHTEEYYKEYIARNTGGGAGDGQSSPAMIVGGAHKGKRLNETGAKDQLGNTMIENCPHCGSKVTENMGGVCANCNMAYNSNPEGINQYTRGMGRIASREGDQVEHGHMSASRFRAKAKEHGHEVKEVPHLSGEGTMLVAKDREGNHRGEFHPGKEVHNKAQRCPYCDEELDEDGECPECGEVFNTAVKNGRRSVWHNIGVALGFIRNDQMRHQQTGQFLPKGGKGGLKQTHAAAKDGHSKHDGDETTEEDGDHDDDDLEEIAAQRGMSVEELKKSMGTRNELKALVANAEKNKSGQPADGDAPAELRGHQTTHDGRDPKTLTEEDDDDFWGGEDYHHKGPTKERSPNNVTNQFGSPYSQTGAPMHHQASKYAAQATLGTEHDGAQKHALKAMKASKDDDHDGAQESHLNAAQQHEDAATDARKDKEPMQAEDHDRAAALHRKAASMHAATQNAKGDPMALSKEQRQQLIAKLTANCKCSDDRVRISNMSNETLLMLNKGPTAEGNFAGKSADGKTAKREKAKEDEEDGDDPNAKDDEDLVGETVPKLAGNQWMAAASPEDREFMQYGREAMRRDKLAIVNRLVANVQGDDQKKAMGTKLMKKSINELRELASLVPVQNRQQQQINNFELDPVYLGQAGPIENVGVENELTDDDTLPIPTLNYAEIAKEREDQRKRGMNETQVM